MIRRLKYYYFKWFKIPPKSITDQVYYVQQHNITPSDIVTPIEVCTANMRVSVDIIEHVLSVEYTTDYAIRLSTDIITETYTTYMHRWYNVGNKISDSDLFNNWLAMLSELEHKYIFGLSQEPLSRPRLNSVKIEPLIKEGASILQACINQD